jgi:hypothetical protein
MTYDMLTRTCRGCGRVVRSPDGSVYWHPSCKSAAGEAADAGGAVFCAIRHGDLTLDLSE